jgi:hypothetical protein
MNTVYAIRIREQITHVESAEIQYYDRVFKTYPEGITQKEAILEVSNMCETIHDSQLFVFFLIQFANACEPEERMLWVQVQSKYPECSTELESTTI